MRRLAIVLLGMCTMADHALLGQDLNRFTRTIKVNGLSFPVLDYGEGSPVLLLHGFPDDRFLGRNQVTALATAGLRVIAPDLRGFGDAPRPADPAEYGLDIAAGAKGVKVWKDIGMEVRDARGEPVQIDHPRFQPIWDFLAEQRVPVLAHIAEPLAAWRPLDPENPHFGYYSANPRYHAYLHPEIPRHEAIIALVSPSTISGSQCPEL